MLINEIKKYPFVRLTIFFIVGIILYDIFEISKLFSLSLFIVSYATLIIINTFSFFSKAYRFRWMHGSLIAIIFISIGLILTSFAKNTPSDIEQLNQELVFAEISQPINEKENSYAAILTISDVKDSVKWTAIEEKIQVYFEKDSLISCLKPGDQIVFKPQLVEIKNSGNPYEFDYKSYMKRKGIFYTQYIKAKNWKKISANNSFNLYYFANDIREKLLHIYKKYDIKEQNFAVLSALTLGYKEELDAETKRAFSASGAMHILAVSGLHVGIILLILNNLLKFLNRKYGLKILKTVIIVTFLWSFAIISGLSPSVLRAATMFTIVATGNIFKRNTYIYNTIAVSALMILLFDPLAIKDVGFQLSYLAVISIVSLHTPIYNQLITQSKIKNYFISLIVLSIVAQIGTAPIALYYFHQFPNYFLLTNIVVVPGAAAILILAILLLTTSFIPFFSSFIAYLLKLTLSILNGFVNFIQHLPFSVSAMIDFSLLQTLSLYLMIVFTISFIYYKKKIHFYLAGIFLVTIFSVSALKSIKLINKNNLIVYNVSKKPVVHLACGANNYVLSDSSGINDEKIDNYILKPVQTELKSKSLSKINIFSDTLFFNNNFGYYNDFLIVGNKRITFIKNRKILENSSEKPMQTDIIIVSNNTYLNIEELTELFEFKLIIFDSSNRINRVERWCKECEELGINFHSVQKSGAYNKLL